MSDHARPLRAIAATALIVAGQRLTVLVERLGTIRSTSIVLDEEGHALDGSLRHRALARYAAGEGERLHEEVEWEIAGSDGRHRLTLVRDHPTAEPRLLAAERLETGARPLTAQECRRLRARLAVATAVEHP